MARGGDTLASLPMEIWGRVASFLTLREYCMLASTCRAFWAMDLAVVKVPVEQQTEIEDPEFDLRELLRIASGPGDGSAPPLLTAQADVVV